MAKHKSVRIKLYWWQRKRLIQMQIQAWLLRSRELKLELFDVIQEIKKQMKEKHG
jgi:hypothetical protein